MLPWPLGIATNVLRNTRRTARRHAAAFLDATLRGRSVDLPAALSRHGDLRVHPPAAALK